MIRNDKGQDATSASSVMIHVGGVYKNEEENKNSKRAGPYYSRIAFTEAHLKELARQGYTPQSVPAACRDGESAR